jgi:hypothetical protein
MNLKPTIKFRVEWKEKGKSGWWHSRSDSDRIKSLDGAIRLSRAYKNGEKPTVRTDKTRIVQITVTKKIITRFSKR